MILLLRLVKPPLRRITIFEPKLASPDLDLQKEQTGALLLSRLGTAQAAFASGCAALRVIRLYLLRISASAL